MWFDRERLSKLDHEKFTLEDIAYTFHMWLWTARIIMNTGIRQGSFIQSGDFYSLAEDK